MAKQDDFTRITLRLPSELHERLTAVAGARSLNAEIVSRLEASFEVDSLVAQGGKALAGLEEGIRQSKENNKWIREHFQAQSEAIAALLDVIVSSDGRVDPGIVSGLRAVLAKKITQPGSSDSEAE